VLVVCHTINWTYLVLVTLVEIDKEDHIVSQSGQAVKSRHLDGECKKIVDERVEKLVCHGARVHVRDTLQAVVDVQAGHHHEKAISIDRADQGGNDEAVPALV